MVSENDVTIYPEFGEKKDLDLITPEEKDNAKITFRDYINFMSFGLGNFGIILLFIACILAATCQLAITYFLGEWTKLDLEGQQHGYEGKAFIGVTLSLYGLALLRCIVVYGVI